MRKYKVKDRPIFYKRQNILAFKSARVAIVLVILLLLYFI